jgi:alpha-tubulin suppressor-like RCC1 family protein
MQNGNLGHGDENKSFMKTPRKVESLNGICVIQIACGTDHTVAITSEGSIYSWGRNCFGKTGHGTTEGHQNTPKILEDLSSKHVLFAAVGINHTACVTRDGGGQLYTWGR